MTLSTAKFVTAAFVKTPNTIATRYYHTDPIGSVRAVTDEIGSVVTRHDYRPFGEDTQPLTGDPNRFAGKQLDAETAMHYFDARYYRQTWGRFSSVDPLIVGAAMTDPQQWNRYAYARNNPLRFVDPTGLFITCPTPETCSGFLDSTGVSVTAPRTEYMRGGGGGPRDGGMTCEGPEDGTNGYARGYNANGDCYGWFWVGMPESQNDSGPVNPNTDNPGNTGSVPPCASCAPTPPTPPTPTPDPPTPPKNPCVSFGWDWGGAISGAAGGILGGAASGFVLGIATIWAGGAPVVGSIASGAVLGGIGGFLSGGVEGGPQEIYAGGAGGAIAGAALPIRGATVRGGVVGGAAASIAGQMGLKSPVAGAIAGGLGGLAGAGRPADVIAGAVSGAAAGWIVAQMNMQNGC